MLDSFFSWFIKKKNNVTADFTNTQSQQQFKHIVNDSPIAIYTCNKNGRIIYYNQAAVELWGTEPETDINFWCGSWKTFYPNGKPMPIEECPMAKALKEGVAYENIEITIERPDHSVRELLVFSRPIFNDKNELIGAHNTLIDISEKISFKKKQNILSAIVESSNDAIISKDITGIITSWNSGAQKIFGYTEQEAIGKHITLLIPDNRLQEEEIILGNIRQGKKVNHYQTIRRHKTGRLIPISLTVSPLKDSENNTIGASKIARDISELIQTQEMLKNYIDNLEILNSIGKVISEKLDVETILQKVTDATTKLTGASFGIFLYNTKDENEEAIKHYTFSGMSKNDLAESGINKENVLFKPAFDGKKIIRISDISRDAHFADAEMPQQNQKFKSYLAVPVTSTGGETIGGLIFCHQETGVFNAEHEDIIGSIASQAAVALENSKLFEEVKALSEKKDEFIALASHELKTPLTSIKGYLQLLEKKLDKNTNTHFIDKALSQVEKLNILIADLLNVSKIEAGKLEFNIEDFEISALLLDVVDTFSHSYKSHDIIFNNAEEIILIAADRQRIEQVIINLLSNAIKYSPKASRVYINLEKTDDHIIVKVKDEGIGLNDIQKKHLFTKFYRAEAIMNVSGLGLGLYLSKEIIERHQGNMQVISEFGKGSEFSFTLPLKKA